MAHEKKWTETFLTILTVHKIPLEFPRNFKIKSTLPEAKCMFFNIDTGSRFEKAPIPLCLRLLLLP